MAIASATATTSQRSADTSARYIGDLLGCYTLSSREEGDDGRVKVFACRARSISAQRVVLNAPISGKVGERLAMRFDGLGILKATVARIVPDGFIADIDTTDVDVAALSSRIDWLKQKQLKALTDQREFKRWTPRQSKSTLVLAGNRKLDCLIIDVSVSGVAVSADVVVELGTPLAVGAILGRVVRKLEAGFAVQFVQTQDAELVESLLVTLEAGRRTAVTRALELAEAAAHKAMSQDAGQHSSEPGA